jgi:hypothetical protein|tara:strand:+ start:1534 stop:1797 length:264 start_codon:yes stop_codon:yes gene_type:complete
MAEMGAVQKMNCQELNSNWLKTNAMSFCHESRKAEVKKRNCIHVVCEAAAQRMTAYFDWLSTKKRYRQNNQLFIPLILKAYTPAVCC